MATRMALASVVVAAFPVFFATSVQAVEGRIGTIRVCSETNETRCTTGAVRQTTLGRQVQLPGGSWVDCAGDCRQKLRIKTVDFWYDQMLRF